MSGEKNSGCGTECSRVECLPRQPYPTVGGVWWMSNGEVVSKYYFFSLFTSLPQHPTLPHRFFKHLALSATAGTGNGGQSANVSCVSCALQDSIIMQ